MVISAAALSALIFKVGDGTGWAQLPAANPLVVPPLPPSAPAQLPAPVTTAVAPPVLAVPTLPAAYSTPAPRVFNCSCYGPGRSTAWVGQVTSSGYFNASQSASGACASYVAARSQRPGTATIAGAANNYGSFPGGVQTSPGSAAAQTSTGSGAAQTGTVSSNSGGASGVQGAGAANNYPGILGATQRAGAAGNYGALPQFFTSSAISCTYCTCD